MNRLGSLDNVATYSIRKFFSHLIKATFYHQHQTPCPRHLSSVRDLSFLPKLIGTDIHWKEISMSSLSNYLQLTPDRLRILIDNPQSLRTNQQECLTAGRSFLEYRLSVQQDLPTRLKHVYTWNLNSWNAPGPPYGTPKLADVAGFSKLALYACKRLNGTKEPLRELRGTSLGLRSSRQQVLS